MQFCLQCSCARDYIGPPACKKAQAIRMTPWSISKMVWDLPIHLKRGNRKRQHQHDRSHDRQ